MASKQVPNQFCMERDHAREAVSEERFFYFEPPPDNPFACPVCDTCKDVNGNPRQVVSTPLEYDENGNPTIPQALKDLRERIGQRS